MSRSARTSARSYEVAGAWTVDRAARAVATACAREPRTVPPVVAVTLTPERVALHLTSPDAGAPAGWSVADDGRTWWIDLRQVPDLPIEHGVTEPFPRLVSLGVNGAGRTLLNLAEADGVISVEGDAARVRGLLETWATRLTTSPWSAGVRVVPVGFGTPESRSGLAEAATLMNEPDGGVLLLAETPHGRDLEYVTWLAGERHRNWSVVVPGADDARWRLTVDESGNVESGLLDEPVRLRA
jgi:hypothetical protein